jgi:hypothetical protein
VSVYADRETKTVKFKKYLLNLTWQNLKNVL